MTEEVHSLPLIGDKAPAFEAKTTHGMVNFPKDYEGKWIVFFSTDY
jgi:peroxiredoxin (alkyl hydroperoxide reductase subunit C)